MKYERSVNGQGGLTPLLRAAGRQAAAYFIGGCGFGENAQNMFASKVYPLLFIAAVFLGSEARLGLVWLLSDIWNGLMAFPNLTALLFLSREVTLPEGFLRRRK